MKNIAYNKTYLDVFSNTYQKTLTPGCTNEKFLNDLENGYSVLTKQNEYHYLPDNSRNQWRVYGSENTVFHDNNEILSFKTIYCASMCKIITHKNGHKYLFYKKDLYGYSIFDLIEKKNFDYFPAASFPNNENETFILCVPFYNPINNFIAVDGCYWAGPYGVILIDFSDPLNSSQLIEKYGYIEHIYHENYGYTFYGWNGTNLILVNDETQDQRIISIPYSTAL